MLPKNTSPTMPWHLRPDPEGVGLRQRWFDLVSPEATKHWQPVSLPATSQHVFGEQFHEITWLRTEVSIPTDWPHAVTRLRFEAVATQASVWVNGEPAGSHTGDYLPFDIDISRWLRTGARLHVVIRVDEMPDHLTKGFHDVTSVHHGGVWQPVRLIGSGLTRAIPDGVAVTGNLRKQQAVVHLDLVEVASAAQVEIAISDPAGATVRYATLALSRHSLSSKVHLGVPDPHPWHPDGPQRYSARITLREGSGVSEVHELRFGFRDVCTDDRHILLNGEPIFLRGILHWGHEPQHIAPAPTPAQVREEFAQLKSMGFNCVGLCMWYPPRSFFEIADEMGMLIWQEHPVWQSSMDSVHLDEYKRLYRAFLRRDRGHSSVILVSATCEHPDFNPELAAWWWATARQELPNALLQLQTSSFAWADPLKTDLHDEHAYDNNDRWRLYLRDLQAALQELSPKPFVMGESVLFHSWPDVAALDAVTNAAPTFFTPAAIDDMRSLESDWTARYGIETVDRFKRQGDRHHLLGRKFQYELFRRYANHAGLVMNHLIDVPACACGFLDALHRWRFAPEDTLPWLCDAPLLLRTPSDRRGFSSGEEVQCSLLLSNLTSTDRRGKVLLRLRIGDEQSGQPTMQRELDVVCPEGDVTEIPFDMRLPDVQAPTRLTLTATMAGTVTNAWDLWVMPAPTSNSDGLYILTGLPFTAHDRRLDREEVGYSCGFGLPAKSWRRIMPDPASAAPHATPLGVEDSVPADARTIITHRLTDRLLDYLISGGNLILFASKAQGSIETKYIWLFGQVPLIIEEGPLTSGDSEWLLDGICIDLNFANGRAIPSGEHGLLKHVDPQVRLAYTHDQSHVVLYDQLFSARVGRGTLIVSSLDHTCPMGRYLLSRLVNWLERGAPDLRAELPIESLRRFTYEAAATIE